MRTPGGSRAFLFSEIIRCTMSGGRSILRPWDSRNGSRQEDQTMPSTIKLHRVLTAKPEKVYRAFIEADALTKWFPPNGFTCTVHHLDAKVGGTFKMSFRNFTTGNSHSFGGEFLELIPGERLRYTDSLRPEPAGRDGGHGDLEGRILRHRNAHHTGRCARHHSSRILLSRLAGMPGEPHPSGGARDQRIDPHKHSARHTLRR